MSRWPFLVFTLALTLPGDSLGQEKPLPTDPDQLIEELGAKIFVRREEAAKAIERLGDKVLPILGKALQHPDPEIRSRADKLFSAISEKSSKAYLLKELSGNESIINDIAFSKDGKQVVAVLWSGTPRVWEVDSGNLLNPTNDRVASLMTVAVSPDGKEFLVGGNMICKSYDFSTGRAVRLLNLEKPGMIWSVRYLKDGKRAILTGTQGMVQLWDVVENKVLQSYEGFRSRVWHAAVSPDEKYLAAGSGSVFDRRFAPDNSIRVWDLKTGKEINRLEGHTSDVRRLVYHPDGKHLLSSSFDTTIRMWDMTTGKEVRRFVGHQAFVEAIQLSPDGKRLYSCSGSVMQGSERAPSRDHSIIVWDIASGKQVLRLVGHQAQVKSIALSPDGKKLASCSEDGSVRIWKTPD